ncbi:hypothetical protein ACEV9W_09015 [Vibrio parahaemolyticus]
MKNILEILRKKENSHKSRTGFTFFADLWMLQDEYLLDLIDFVKKNEIKVESDFLKQLKKSSREKLDYIQSKVEVFNFPSIQRAELERWYEKDKSDLLAKVNTDSIDGYACKYKKELISNYYSIGNNSITLKVIYAKALAYENLFENAVYLNISEYLFDKYKIDYALENFDYKSLMVSDDVKSKLKEIYGSSALCKYSLFKLDLENQVIMNKEEFPYIFDQNNQSDYLMLNPKDKRVIEVFQDLIDKGYVNDISFKISSVEKFLVALEDAKYGQKFSLNLEDLPDLSVFYDLHNHDDHLWIYVRKEKNNKFSITFEETIEDLFFDKNENVITNLIHLEVTNENGLDVISHIDHEYIIYAMDTYINRLDNSSVKGEYKIKTFKIDNAAIPLDYKFYNCNVLYHIVYECMEKKSLVKEYFENLA